MPTTDALIAKLLAEGGGVLLARDHPGLARTLRRRVADGELVAVLAGTFCVAGDTRLPTRLRAVAARYADAVIMGTAAARVGFWPEAPVERIEVARPLAVRSADCQAGSPYVFRKRRIPARPHPRQRRDAPHHCIPHRARAVRGLRQRDHPPGAAQPHRHGRLAARRVRGDPEPTWEHRADARPAGHTHRTMVRGRAVGAPTPGGCGDHRLGANHPIGLRLGLFLQRYHLDIAFGAQKVAIEIEGNAYHGSGQHLTRDRFRHNDLTLAGWTVYRIDWQMLTTDQAYVLALVRAALG